MYLIQAKKWVSSTYQKVIAGRQAVVSSEIVLTRNLEVNEHAHKINKVTQRLMEL